MAKNTSVSLGDHYDTFVAEQLKSGRYSGASEVIRSALRLLEEREARISALNRALEKGERSGFTDGFDTEEIVRILHQRMDPDLHL